MGGPGVGPRGRRQREVVRIRAAQPGEQLRLREIAAAAKGHWGYESERVRAWAETLDFSQGAVPGRELFVAELDGVAVGLASAIPGGRDCVLEDLWVDPPAMNRGVGLHLLRHAADRARSLGAERLVWEAEPNAVGFYERAGASVVGESEPSGWGRRLPLMALDLA